MHNDHPLRPGGKSAQSILDGLRQFFRCLRDLISGQKEHALSWAAAVGRCDLLSAVFPLASAFLYGENLLGQPQRTQACDSQEICRAAGRAESKEGLRRPHAITSGCESDAGGESLPGVGPAAGVYSAIQNFPVNFPRTGIQRPHPWRHQIKLVNWPKEVGSFGR